MKHISILVPKGEAVLSSIVGAFKVFNKVNDYWKASRSSEENFFEIDLVGIDKKNELYGGLFQVNPNKTLEQVKRTDLIVITTIFGDFNKAIALNAPIIEWIKIQRTQHQAEVASLCTGAFLLAETGLLNGKACATHWIAHQEFQQKYPQVNLLPEKIISEDNGIYSSGGAYSFLNLLLHLVEKYCGKETAIWAAKLFEIEFNRNDQSQFSIFKGQKEHSDAPVKEAQLYIESHFEDKISVEQLANKYAISRRNFVRRFKKATSNTPLEYVQRVKVEAAKHRLESTSQYISEVMHSVGYNDDKAFRNIFKKFTGLSPIEYRSKYNREAVMATIG